MVKPKQKTGEDTFKNIKVKKNRIFCGIKASFLMFCAPFQADIVDFVVKLSKIWQLFVDFRW